MVSRLMLNVHEKADMDVQRSLQLNLSAFEDGVRGGAELIHTIAIRDVA
jgi:hypothetical protein